MSVRVLALYASADSCQDVYCSTKAKSATRTQRICLMSRPGPDGKPQSGEQFLNEMSRTPATMIV
jgi:hypothetical protein